MDLLWVQFVKCVYVSKGKRINETNTEVIREKD